MKGRYKILSYCMFIAISMTTADLLEAKRERKKINRSTTYGLLTAGASDEQSYADAMAPLTSLQTHVDANALINSPGPLQTPTIPAPIIQDAPKKIVPQTKQALIQTEEKSPTLPKLPTTNIIPASLQGPPAPEKQKLAQPDQPNQQNLKQEVGEQNKQNENNKNNEKKIAETDTIEFHFENADLQNLVAQIEEFYNVTFISQDAISPAGQGAKLIKGNKITFKTHAPLSRQKAWDLFVTFLYISGFAIVPTADQKFYKISPINIAQKSPEPTFIGVDPATLPDNDQIIRYVYFITNSTVDVISGVVNMLRSKESLAQPLQDSKAILLIDKAYNIKTLMQIVKELDKVTMPQEMAVLKLRRVDALEVKKLYDELTQSEDKNFARFFTTRKQPTSLYFPENARIFAEPRTNALILLGPKDALKKIEDFIIKYVDVELDQPYSPIQTYQLKYANAATVAKILNELTKFGKDTKAGENGGVRGIDKYLRPMSFTPEEETNKIIIRGDYEDYLQVKEVIEKLDEPQPQVAIEVLILSIRLNTTKELGVQMRSKDPGADGLLGKNVKFQTSGLFVNGAQRGIQENASGSGVTRLLADMIKLITGGDQAGSTILTLGSDKFGVWGVFKMLESISNSQVISNPFVTTTNKTKATVKVGQTRRVTSGTVIAGSNQEQSQTDDEANLQLDITPLINSDGKIVLDIDIQINSFAPDASAPTLVDGEIKSKNVATKLMREIKTNAIVANKEVLALGGLIRTEVTDKTTKVPILGDIPILGWLFKNKQKTQSKDNLLVLISSQIIRPDVKEETLRVTRARLEDYDETLHEMTDLSQHYDPVYRAFFKSKPGDTERVFDDYAKKKVGYAYKHVENGRGKKPRKKKRKKGPSREYLTISENKKGPKKSKHKQKKSPSGSTTQLAYGDKQPKELTTSSIMSHFLSDSNGGI